MSEDITFCFYSKCQNKKCERHASNIRILYEPHSYAFFKDCEYWDIPDIVLELSGVKDNGYIVRKSEAEEES